MVRWLLAGGLVAAAISSGSSANATPQYSGALTTGASIADLRAGDGPRVAGHLGGRFDVLLLRERANTMAVGPYVEVMTEAIGKRAFELFESGGGVEWLVPAGDTAFVFSGGGFVRSSQLGWTPGAAAGLFWGSRSFNYHSSYSLSLGLFAQGRYGFQAAGKQADVVVGLQADLAYLAMPFIYAYEAIAH
jgi:hypothetical protein